MSVQETRLLVLGIVRLRGPIHGYGIQRELSLWNADEWAGIARASVYNQLRTLTKAGFLRAEPEAPTERGPSKSLHTLTQAGEAEFQRLLSAALWNTRPQPRDLLAALCFLPALTAAETVAAIEERVRIVTSFLDQFDESMQQWFPSHSPVLHVQEVFLLTREAFVAELRWAAAFLERLRRGDYRLSDQAQ